MKISEIKAYLDYYDTKKGWGRLIRDEPHIAELRGFYNKLTAICKKYIKNQIDRELNPTEELELICLILGKNNWDDSESAFVFTELLKHFGGRIVLRPLRYLKDHEQLTEENVQLIKENNSFCARNLTELMVILYDRSSPAKFKLREVLPFIDLPSISEKFKEIEGLAGGGPLSAEMLILIGKKQSTGFTGDVLLLLNKYKLGDEENTKRIAQIKDINSLNRILAFLEEASPLFIRQSNLDRFYELDDINDTLRELIETIHVHKKVTQVNLEKLFNYEQVIGKNGAWLRETAKKYRHYNWDLERHLDGILTNAADSGQLNTAIDILNESGINPALAQRILDKLTQFPKHQSTVISGAKTLLKHDLLFVDYLDIILAEPEYADKLAAAIHILSLGNVAVDKIIKKRIFGMPQFANKLAEAQQILKTMPDNPEIENIVFNQPQYADTLALVFKELIKEKAYNDITLNLVASKPETSGIVAKILEYWGKHVDLCNEKNIQQLYDKNLDNRSFRWLLYELENADLLDNSFLLVDGFGQRNLDKLFANAQYIKTLTSACICLRNGEKLNQSSFDALMDDPVHALAIAENLGGKTRATSTSHIDEGAKSFVRIRNVATFFAVAQQKNIFFPNVDAADFKTKTKKNIDDVLEKTWKNIAVMCGDDKLEDEVAETIANKAYHYS